MSATNTGGAVVATLLCDALGVDRTVVGFEATEELGRAYRWYARIAIAEDSFDLLELTGADAGVDLERDAHARHFFGVIDRVSLGDRYDGFQHGVLEIVPALAGLRYTRTSRIFQEKSALAIIEEVLREKLSPYRRQIDSSTLDPGDYPNRDYCVQYQETDFDFVHRLLEEEGIGYYFDFDERPEKLVLFDRNRSLVAASTIDGGPVRFDPLLRNVAGAEPIVAFHSRVSTGPTGVTVRDHDWTRPRSRIEVTGVRPDERGRTREIYEHGHERKLTISEDNEILATMVTMAQNALIPAGLPMGLGGAIRELTGPAIGNFTRDDAARQGRLRYELARRDHRLATGTGAVIGFSAGSRFELVGHPTDDGEYVVTRVVHRIGDSGDRERYRNEFECLPLTTPWRPSRTTPRPHIFSVQTATVTGPPGSNIHTDQHGRVKVTFHWDRAEPDLMGNTSCWLRVSQAWAGEGFPGFVFIPRVGMEVIVAFIDGDPDRPLVTGCVHNARNPPPNVLPIEATKSTIRTRTVPHGPGYNELSFEDAMGMERVHLRAERDLDELVKRDHTSVVFRDERHLTKRDRTERVGRNFDHRVGGDRSVDVAGSESIAVGGDHQRLVGGAERLQIGGRQETIVERGSRFVHVMQGEHLTEAKLGLFLRQGPNRLAMVDGHDGQGGENGPKGIGMSSPNEIRMIAGPTGLGLNTQDGVVTLAGRNGSISISDDKIEIKMGASTLLVTPAFIKANAKTFPPG